GRSRARSAATGALVALRLSHRSCAPGGIGGAWLNQSDSRLSDRPDARRRTEGTQGPWQDRSQAQGAAAAPRVARFAYGRGRAERARRPDRTLRSATAAATVGWDAATSARSGGQARWRTRNKEKESRQEGQHRSSRRARDARAAGAEKAPRPARQGTAKDRDHHAQGLQTRGSNHRRGNGRRSRPLDGRQGRRPDQEVDGTRPDGDAEPGARR